MADTTPVTDSIDGADPEADPERYPRTRRGRPRVTPPAWDCYAEMNEWGKSRQTHVKRYHTTKAVVALGEDRKFVYLMGDVETGEIARLDVLAELGRLGDQDVIRGAAAKICGRRMRAKEAVALLRHWRIGKVRPGDVASLAREIEKAVHAYVIRHPDTSRDQVRAALKLVGICFAGVEGLPGEDDDPAAEG